MKSSEAFFSYTPLRLAQQLSPSRGDRRKQNLGRMNEKGEEGGEGMGGGVRGEGGNLGKGEKERHSVGLFFGSLVSEPH